MSKSIKLTNNTYIDSSSVVYNSKTNDGIIPINEMFNMWNCHLPETKDFNTTYKTGLYLWTHETANAPLSGSTYGIVFCFTSYGYIYNQVNNWLFQIAIRTDSTKGIYLRRKINANDWEDWFLIS